MSESNPELPVVNIEGDRVALGPLRQDLIPVYHRWMNDLVGIDRLGLPPEPMTVERETSWYDQAASSSDPIAFTIYERSTWRPVGTCTLTDVDHRHGTAGLVIHIGERADRGQGYGTEALRLLLDYAFTVLGIHNVMLSVDEFNSAGRRAYAKAGFREIGRRRQAVVMAGRRGDEIFMDCLASEFESPVLASLFAPNRRPT